MNPEIKTQWVNALRSGDYKQGHYMLAATIPETSETRYCCLGVLCELAADAGIIDRTGTDFRGRNTYGSEREVLTLPEAVQKWAGLNGPDSENPQVTIANGDVHAVAVLNDEGDETDYKPYTFPRIANLIESQL